jgi:DNA polymerase III delta subunit
VGWVAEACGGDLYRATNELDKLAAWQATTPDEPIELETARELVIGNERLTGWEVSDAIMDRNPAQALTALRTLLGGGAEPLQMLGGIAWRARVMLQAKSLLARRTPPREVISATRAFYFGDRLLAGLRRYSLDDLLQFPDLLRTADRALKGGLVPGASVMEQLVERMTMPK